ncbi:MAG: DUF4115 domain-containing protein [Proteobacteria bacterium]|nr:DUF4115 domain-containing protein [Pseudomonadota bacterium]
MSEAEVGDAISPAAKDASAVAVKAAGPGAQLAAQREAQGWTVEQVASQLNMATRQIHALESNHFAALPGMVVVRGFLRSYAKLLKLDPAPLLAMVAEESAAQPADTIELKRALSAPYTESSLPPMVKPASTSRGLLLFACLVLLVAAGWMAYRNGLLPMPIAEQAGSKTLSAAEAVSSATVTSPSLTTEERTQASTTVELPATVSTTTPATTQPSAPSVTKVDPPIVQAVQELTQPATEQKIADKPALPDPLSAPVDGKNSLVLNVRKDAWVEIRRADKVVVVSRLLKAGTTAAFEVTQPVSLIVGNAAGVDVSLRGKPLDPKAAKNNVIRLDVK